MGGNIRIGNIKPNIIQLENEKDFRIFVFEISKFVSLLNSAYFGDFGENIWNEDVISRGLIFGGSTGALMFSEKPVPRKMGDIDLLVDIKKIDNLIKIFHKVELAYPKVKFHGHKKTTHTVSTLWKFENFGINIQIDFAGIEYQKGSPVAWDFIFHSSNQADNNIGIKGVFHKYALRAMTSLDLVEIDSKLQNRIAVSGNGWRIKPDFKYSKDFDEFVRVVTKNKEKDATNFYSCQCMFNALRGFSEENQETFTKGFISLLWGKSAQKLYIDSKIDDFEVKSIAFEKLNEIVFDSKFKFNFTKLWEEYYEKF